MSPIQLLCFFFVAAAWGGSFVAIRIVATEWWPVTAAFWRVAIAGLVIGSYLLISRHRWTISRSRIIQLFFIGWCSMGFPFIFLFKAEQHVSAAMASILNSTTPLLTLMIGMALSRRWPPVRHRWGILLGGCGVITIFAPQLVGSSIGNIVSMAAVLMTSMLYAISITWTRRVSPHVSGAPAFFIQTLGATSVLAIASIVMEGGPLSHMAEISQSSLLSVLYLAIISTAIAWLMFFKIIKEVGAVQAASTVYLVPVVTIVGEFFIGHIPTVAAIIGMAMILSGVYLTQARLKPLRSYTAPLSPTT